MDLLEQMETSGLQEGEEEKKEKEKEEGDSVVRSSSLDVMALLEQMETSDLQEGEGEKEEKEKEEKEEENLMETSDLQEEKEEEESRLLQMPSVIMVEGGVDPPTNDALEPETDTRTRKEAEPANSAPAVDNLPLPSDPDAGDNPPLQSDPDAGDNPPLQSDPEEGDNPPLPSDPDAGDNPPLQSDPDAGDNPPLQSDPDAGDNPPVQSDPDAGDNPPLQSDPIVENRQHLQPDSEIVVLVSAGGLTCDDHGGLPSDSGAHSELLDYKKHHGLCGETPSPSLVVTESGGDNNYSLSGTALLREEDYQAAMAAAEWVEGKMEPHPGVNTRRDEDYRAMIVAAEWVGGKMEPLCPPRREEEEESDGFLMPECKDDRNVPVVVLEPYSSGSDQSPCIHRDDRKGKVLDTTTSSVAPAPTDPIVLLQPATSSQRVCKNSESSNAPVIDEVIDVVGSPQTVRSQRPQGNMQPEGSQQGTTQGWYSRFVGLPYMVYRAVMSTTPYDSGMVTVTRSTEND